MTPATAIVKLTVVIQLLVTAVTVPAIQAAVTAVRVLRKKNAFRDGQKCGVRILRDLPLRREGALFCADFRVIAKSGRVL